MGEKKSKEEKEFTIWKLYKIQISVPTNQLLWAQATPTLSCPELLSAAAAALSNWEEALRPERLKCLHLALSLSRKGLLTPALNGYTVY